MTRPSHHRRPILWPKQVPHAVVSIYTCVVLTVSLFVESQHCVFLVSFPHSTVTESENSIKSHDATSRSRHRCLHQCWILSPRHKLDIRLFLESAYCVGKALAWSIRCRSVWIGYLRLKRSFLQLTPLWNCKNRPWTGPPTAVVETSAIDFHYEGINLPASATPEVFKCNLLRDLSWRHLMARKVEMFSHARGQAQIFTAGNTVCQNPDSPA